MDDLLFLEPRSDLDRFIVGIGSNFEGNPSLVYDTDGLLGYWSDSFMDSDPQLSEEEAHVMAVEWFEYNVLGAYVGEHTPTYVSRSEFDIFMENLSCKED